MTIKRGDIVICSLSGDYGKPRPAVVVQSDIFNPTHASIVICPITSYLVNAPLFRLQLDPTASNGLKNRSQIMVDKIAAIKSEKIPQKIGVISINEIERLNQALKFWLAI